MSPIGIGVADLVLLLLCVLLKEKKDANRSRNLLNPPFRREASPVEVGPEAPRDVPDVLGVLLRELLLKVLLKLLRALTATEFSLVDTLLTALRKRQQMFLIARRMRPYEERTSYSTSSIDYSPSIDNCKNRRL